MNSHLLAGRSHSGQTEQLKPDALLRLTLGGLTLTLLEEDPPSRPDGTSSLADMSQVFFRELAFFKDSMFSERDFHSLKAGFTKACPHSHLRLKTVSYLLLGNHLQTGVTSTICFCIIHAKAMTCVCCIYMLFFSCVLNFPDMGLINS